eukprot:scaffold432_cov345-Prasinococcus_capsulatus_cf.AAC.4
MAPLLRPQHNLVTTRTMMALVRCAGLGPHRPALAERARSWLAACASPRTNRERLQARVAVWAWSA